MGDVCGVVVVHGSVLSAIAPYLPIAAHPSCKVLLLLKIRRTCWAGRMCGLRLFRLMWRCSDVSCRVRKGISNMVYQALHLHWSGLGREVVFEGVLHHGPVDPRCVIPSTNSLLSANLGSGDDEDSGEPAFMTLGCLPNSCSQCRDPLMELRPGGGYLRPGWEFGIVSHTLREARRVRVIWVCPGCGRRLLYRWLEQLQAQRRFQRLLLRRVRRFL